MSQTKQRKSRLTRQMLEDELERARIRRVNVTEDMVTQYLEDGRVLGMPTVCSPRLSEASEAECQNYGVIGHGMGLTWMSTGVCGQFCWDGSLPSTHYFPSETNPNDKENVNQR